MTDEIDLTDEIVELASQPKKSVGPDGSVLENQDIDKLATAQKLLREAAPVSATRPGAGLRFQQITPYYP